MHVNTGASREEQATNCALCTAAALTGQSSGDVALDLQVLAGISFGPVESDQAFTQFVRDYGAARTKRVRMGDAAVQPVADQMIGMAVYVSKKLNDASGQAVGVTFCGSPVDRTRAAQVLPQMNQKPDGTKFAVFTSDGSSLYGDEAHWIFAEKAGGALTFTDYQTDTQTPNGAPTSSPHPLRPGGAAYTTGAASNPNTFMIAVAFRG